MNNTVLTQDELQRAVREIFRRSQTDPEFRALCLSDPHAALRRLTGKTPPPGTDIRFVEQAMDQPAGPREPTKRREPR